MISGHTSGVRGTWLRGLGLGHQVPCVLGWSCKGFETDIGADQVVTPIFFDKNDAEKFWKQVHDLALSPKP
jgi:hypothetical protein